MSKKFRTDPSKNVITDQAGENEGNPLIRQRIGKYQASPLDASNKQTITKAEVFFSPGLVITNWCSGWLIVLCQLLAIPSAYSS